MSKSVLEGDGGERTITGPHEIPDGPCRLRGGPRQEQLTGDVRGAFGQSSRVQPLHRIRHPEMESLPARQRKALQQRLPGQLMTKAETRVRASRSRYHQMGSRGLLESLEHGVVVRAG